MIGDLQMKIGLAENAFAPNCEAAFTEQWLVPHLTTDDKQFSEFLSAREDLRIASPTWIHKSFNDTLPVSRIVYGAQYGLVSSCRTRLLNHHTPAFLIVQSASVPASNSEARRPSAGWWLTRMIAPG
jgi:hypothetical protein